MRVVILFLALWLAPVVAVAHGDAQWIADGHYTGIDGIHCCGPADCSAFPADAIKRVDGGWQIVETGQLFKDEERGIYESTDLQVWLCRRYSDHRCLFFPRSGT